jgi:hypothetical protein
VIYIGKKYVEGVLSNAYRCGVPISVSIVIFPTPL